MSADTGAVRAESVGVEGDARVTVEGDVMRHRYLLPPRKRGLAGLVEQVANPTYSEIVTVQLDSEYRPGHRQFLRSKSGRTPACLAEVPAGARVRVTCTPDWWGNGLGAYMVRPVAEVIAPPPLGPPEPVSCRVCGGKGEKMGFDRTRTMPGFAAGSFPALGSVPCGYCDGSGTRPGHHPPLPARAPVAGCVGGGAEGREEVPRG